MLKNIVHIDIINRPIVEWVRKHIQIVYYICIMPIRIIHANRAISFFLSTAKIQD